MNHYVPDFEMEEDYSIPTSSALTRPKKSSAMAEEGIMELLWQNGQVVVQSQTQRTAVKKSHMAAYTGMPAAENPLSVREMRSDEEQALPPPPPPPPPQLFMQEDEMASWLHYPLDDVTFDRDLYADLLYPPVTCDPVAVTAALPSRTNVHSTEILTPRPASIPLPRCADVEVGSSRFQNFKHFSRAARDRMDSCGPSSSSRGMKESSTVVDSNETPAAALGLESRGVSISNAVDSCTPQIPIGGNFCFRTFSGTAGAAPFTSTACHELATTSTCELTVTSSSPGGSGASACAEPQQKQQAMTAAAADDRKRKARETDDAAEYHSEDVDFESVEARKQVRGSTSAKRSRAAEVHNLSERRRRDRINEKMRALQELIPRCNKSDKASMLDEAIEYLKSLQLQVQMMSMGCGMVPMVYPGVQQYMPPMGMGMGMGMNRPMVPFPPVLPVPNPAARFPMPAFHMQPVPVPDPSRMQTTGQPEPMLNSNQPRLPNFTDPYQQYIGLQLPRHQNQVMQPSSSKPSSSRGVENPENHQSGTQIVAEAK